MSTMGLMNVGKSEGAQIIQLFGRGGAAQGLRSDPTSVPKKLGTTTCKLQNAKRDIAIWGCHRLELAPALRRCSCPFPRRWGMYSGKLVFAQVMDHLPMHTFRRAVSRYGGKPFTSSPFRATASFCAWRSPNLRIGRVCEISRSACVRSDRSSITWAFAARCRATPWPMRTSDATGESTPRPQWTGQNRPFCGRLKNRPFPARDWS